MRSRAEESVLVAAARSGEEAAFGRLVEPLRGELVLHCYRMLANLEDAEDAVQDSYLRAWRALDRFEGRSSIRVWLYRIATNTCLDQIDRTRRRRRLATVRAPDTADVIAAVEVPWLTPCPDSRVDAVARTLDPAAAAVAQETAELAVLTALQHLTPVQRACVILRDVAGWTAAECADALATSVPAVNSATQRGRSGLRARLGPSREAASSARTSDVRADEAAVLRRYITAVENADQLALSALLAQDVRCSHQAGAGGNLDAVAAWYAGKETVLEAWRPLFEHLPPPALRAVLAPRVNAHPALATYLQMPETDTFEAFALNVLAIDRSHIREIATFGTDTFTPLGLPTTLQAPT
ncbi:MAG: RNA polymerase subunit sigma-70 [Angustibacter sp.]